MREHRSSIHGLLMRLPPTDTAGNRRMDFNLELPKDHPMNRRQFVLASLSLPLLPKVALATPTRVTVYRSPTCGCCGAWVEHVRAAGFDVTTILVDQGDQLWSQKVAGGVPENLASCHTAFIDGYTIEGHVPAEDIARLLSERPKARGLAVPGMPAGSPGMEMGARMDAYNVMLFSDDAEPSVYSSHG
jgi:hypothetical protein